MVVRIVTVVAVVATFGNSLFAQQNGTNPKVGDHLVVRMTGDLAKEYSRCAGWPGKDAKSLQIDIVTTILQQFDDGRIRFELTSPVKTDGKLARLVTLSATVDSSKVVTKVSPKGTPVYSSPADHKNGVAPKLTAEETKRRQVELSELKDVKLRTWALTEEIGNGDSN